MHFLMSPTTNPAAVAHTDFLHSWGGGDPTILYNITGYGLNGLFFEIQTETRFPINFNWEIFCSMGTYLTQANSRLGKKVWIFLQK